MASNFTIGYDDARFESIVDQNFHCLICYNVLKDPVMCRRNQHYFCHGCITEHLRRNSHTCPTCADELTVETLGEVPRIVKTYLNERRIRCDYEDRGCRELVQLQNLNRHVAECGFSPVVCGNQGCGQTISKRDRTYHERELCQFRKLKCHNCEEISTMMADLERKIADLNTKMNTNMARTNREMKNMNTNMDKNLKTKMAHTENIDTKLANTDTKLETVREQMANMQANMEARFEAVNNEMRGMTMSLNEMKDGFDHLKEAVLEKVESKERKQEEITRDVTEARSLALEFVSAHPFCLAAVPYENKDTQAQTPLTMCLYVNTGGNGIPNDFEDAAHEMFANYEVRFDDFYERPRGKTFTPNSLSEKEREKKLSDVNEAIERILHLFEDRMNVTALQASFKVVDSIEQEIPCVRVFVLKKGSIPAGETAFPKTVEEIDYELDVAEGYYQSALGAISTKRMSPLRGGAQISVSEKRYAGTLGGFLKDDEGKHYIISCQHILYDPEEDSIVHPATGVSRSIGNYVGGYKGGVQEKYWVDAAIAELKEKEVKSITASDVGDGQCFLYGFEEPTLNGQIGDVNKFISGEVGTLKFTKIGQKTGRTDSATCIPRQSLRIKKHDGIRKRTMYLSSKNCIIVHSDAGERFCDEGDSGSLFFDNDGRAWGVYFGVFNDILEVKTYFLASLLGKCLETLEKATKKSNLHLWAKEESESQTVNCQNNESPDVME